jgi:hypothetical protein
MSFKSVIIVLFALLIVVSFCEEKLTVEDSNDKHIPTDESNAKDSNVSSEKNEMAIEFENYSRKLIDEMGINNQKEINREKFTLFLTRLFTRDEKLEDHELPLVDRLIKKVIEKVPELIQVNELYKYIQYDRLMIPMEEIIKEVHGEEAIRYNEDRANSDL